MIEVAEMAGHDVRETQRTYARLNLRKKGTQITLPELGKKPNGGEVVGICLKRNNDKTNNNIQAIGINLKYKRP